MVVPLSTDTIHTGRLEYRGEAGLRGREEFSITCATDGTRTLQAHCRMFDTRVERWVLHTVDAGMRPLRSVVSQHRDGEFQGEGRFTFTPAPGGGTRLEGRSTIAGAGEVHQVREIDGALDYFVPHAVAGDSWITPCHDRSAAGWREVPNGFTTSLLPDGSTGPAIEQHRGIRQRLVGREVVRVPAGEYLVDHFEVSPRPDVVEHLWVSADEVALLVKLRSDRLATTYLLTEHQVGDRWS